VAWKRPSGPARCAVALGTMALLALTTADSCSAGDLSDEAFGLRIGLALDRASTFTDVVGLSASTAYPYLSSVNPAAGDFLREPPNEFRFIGTLTGAYVAFNNGSSIIAGAASATYRLPAAGTVLASYTRIDSQDVESHQGDHFTLRSNELRLSYSHLLDTWIAVGGSVRLGESRLSRSTLFEDFPLHTSTESQGVEGSIGVLVAPHRHWLLGILVALGWTRGETAGSVDLPPPPFGPGLTPVDFTDNTRSLNIRGGLGWRPSEKFGAYADWQYLRLENVRTGSSDDSADVGRMFAGVEYLPVQFLALRLGGSADTDRQFTVSTGVGFYPTKYLQAELAYVYNAFPEIRKEFGRAHLISISLAFVF
jgi:opacity protein-like surface antigen